MHIPIKAALLLVTVFTLQVSRAQSAPTLSADADPVLVAAGQNAGSANITRNAEKNKDAEVWRKVDNEDETRFSDDSKGTLPSVIRVGRKYIFTLYNKKAFIGAMKNPLARVLDSITVSAIVEIGDAAPTRDRHGVWKFPDISSAFSRFVTGKNGRYTLELNVDGNQLEPNKTYHFVIKVLNDAATDPKRKMDQYTSKFTTQDQTVRIVWESIHISNDSDPNDSGELFFQFFMNHGDGSAKYFETGRLDLPDGRDHLLNKTVIVNQARDTLSLTVNGDDDDTIWFVARGELPFNGPRMTDDLESNVAKAEIDLSQFPGKNAHPVRVALDAKRRRPRRFTVRGKRHHPHHARLKPPDDQHTLMQDTINGIIPFIIFMALVFAASRVLVRFTGAKYSNALTPLAPIINGAFDTDSLSHRWLTGTYGNRKVGVASTPGVNELGGLITPNNTSKAHRYNAFDVEAQDVAGEADWSLTWGMHNVGHILSREQSWKFMADEDLLQRLQSSNIVSELETFAGAGVRGLPTVIYNARRKTLTHRDNVSPDIAPSPEHFKKQLELVLRLAQINEQINRI